MCFLPKFPGCEGGLCVRLVAGRLGLCLCCLEQHGRRLKRFESRDEGKAGPRKRRVRQAGSGISEQSWAAGGAEWIYLII